MSVVYFCHNVDTEGPLSTEYPISNELPNAYPVNKVEFSACDYDELVEIHRATVLKTRAAVHDMLTRGLSVAFRKKHADSFGNPWVCNWFCMDHVGFVDNPRHRAMGIHAVFDFYRDLIKREGWPDTLQWHFHPHHNYGEGHRCAVSYMNSPELYTLLGRRLLDRKWFPQVNRPGCQDERQDAHWFLEQWVPFDFANAGGDSSKLRGNPDLLDGRVSDWRFAPCDWRTYHPHHDCVQLEGNCRRKIAQSASLLNRFAPLTEEGLSKAFLRAADGVPTLVGLESHDWRDITLEIEYFKYLLEKVSEKFSNVPYKFGTAVEVFNAVHPPKQTEPVKLKCQLHFDGRGLPSQLYVTLNAGKLFGPQPFFVVRTRSKTIIHDSLNFWKSLNDYSYTFDEDRILPTDVEAIGIATNDDAGNQSIHVIELDEIPCGANSSIQF